MRFRCRRGAAPLVAAAALAGLAAACHGTQQPQAPPDTGMQCADDSACAGGVCLQLTADLRVCSGPCEENAGCVPGWQCNNVAGRGTVCTCAPSSEICDGMDNDCDGVVDNQAPADSDCSGHTGVRAYACLAGVCVCAYVECAGECIDVAADPAHADCGDACVDVANDPAHCGGCAPCPTPRHTATSCQAATCITTCDEGFFDCDGDPATGCEVDLTADPENCGTCGRSCGGDPCEAGSCHVTTLTAALWATVIAVDDANVYWTTMDGDINSVPVTGGDTTTLATAELDVGDLAVDGTSVYWSSNSDTCGAVKKVPRGGGSPVVLVNGCDAGFRFFLGWVAVDATDLWFEHAVGSLGYFGNIHRVPRDGGSPTAWGGEFPYLQAWAVGPTHACIFRAMHLELFCGPKYGGAIVSFGTGYGVGLPRFTVSSDAAYVNSGASYCGSSQCMAITAVPLDGSPPAVLGDGVPADTIPRILADEEAVYWIAQSSATHPSGTFWKVPLTGGTPTAIATCPSWASCDFAVDATSFYWLDSGTILRMAK